MTRERLWRAAESWWWGAASLRISTSWTVHRTPCLTSEQVHCAPCMYKCVPTLKTNTTLTLAHQVEGGNCDRPWPLFAAPWLECSGGGSTARRPASYHDPEDVVLPVPLLFLFLSSVGACPVVSEEEGLRDPIHRSRCVWPGRRSGIHPPERPPSGQEAIARHEHKNELMQDYRYLPGVQPLHTTVQLHGRRLQATSAAGSCPGTCLNRPRGHPRVP